MVPRETSSRVLESRASGNDVELHEIILSYRIYITFHLTSRFFFTVDTRLLEFSVTQDVTAYNITSLIITVLEFATAFVNSQNEVAAKGALMGHHPVKLGFTTRILLLIGSVGGF